MFAPVLTFSIDDLSVATCHGSSLCPFPLFPICITMTATRNYISGLARKEFHRYETTTRVVIDSLFVAPAACLRADAAH